jgi:hypothetical protein
MMLDIEANGPPPPNSLTVVPSGFELDSKPAFFIRYCAKLCGKACSDIINDEEHVFVPVELMKCAFDCVEECVVSFKFP